MHNTLELLQPSNFPRPIRKTLETLQINIGLRCNLSCLHCHVNSNPYRTEKMDRATIDLILEFLIEKDVRNLDITGGAPEMHPEFRDLILEARSQDIHVIDRCNLTILLEPGFEDMSEFLANNKVEIIASLPCYLEENVDQQRGKGVYQDSIMALKNLNQAGYGQDGSGLLLNLVYNPLGPTLPPSQVQLEQTYKDFLFDQHGITFNQLFTLCNMPIKRFGSTLVSRGKFQQYISLLKNAHRQENLENIMCRTLISVDWQGYVYDCDFNQMLGLNIKSSCQQPIHLSDCMNSEIAGGEIIVRDHCYGCTAGQGSSCGGALK